MISRLKELASAYGGLRRFQALPGQERGIVFYAEGPGDWPHYEPILRKLLQTHGPIPYVTSTASDPVLTNPPAGILPFYVGFGAIQTVFFQGLRAGLLVTTLPDLDRLHLKRSSYPVHYLYVFHSINSTHMVYRKGAFDAYDTVLCVGPRHYEELRETESVYGLKPKELVKHGYGRLDAILERARGSAAPAPRADGRKRVLYAPSWGVGSSIEAPCGRELIRLLLQAGYATTLRLHPMTARHHPALAPQMEREFGDGSGQFQVETNMSAQESLQAADVMVSDWSGAAFEFAFGLERPVIFIDTPPKINNPEYDRLKAIPLEKAARTELGGVVSPDALGEAPAAIERLCAEGSAFRPRLIQARERWIYNVGASGSVAAQAIADTFAGLERRQQTKAAGASQ